MNMCEPCDAHFTSSSVKFPSWILSNNLTLLPLSDDLLDIRDSEIQLVTPTLRTHNIATITHGNTDKNTFVRSHTQTYGAHPTLSIGAVPFPLLVTRAFNVSIVGAYTSDMKAIVANTYEIRPEKSLRLLALCQERKNASVMQHTCHSLMKDILELSASSMAYLFLII